jgi:hypothetical protein
MHPFNRLHFPSHDGKSFQKLFKTKMRQIHALSDSRAMHAGQGNTSITPRHFTHRTFWGSFIDPSGQRERTLPMVL